MGGGSYFVVQASPQLPPPPKRYCFEHVPVYPAKNRLFNVASSNHLCSGGVWVTAGALVGVCSELLPSPTVEKKKTR